MLCLQSFCEHMCQTQCLNTLKNRSYKRGLSVSVSVAALCSTPCLILHNTCHTDSSTHVDCRSVGLTFLFHCYILMICSASRHTDVCFVVLYNVRHLVSTLPTLCIKRPFVPHREHSSRSSVSVITLVSFCGGISAFICVN
jgi:hypothetical protein